MQKSAWDQLARDKTLARQDETRLTTSASICAGFAVQAGLALTIRLRNSCLLDVGCPN
jgi:hypothetical protein